MPTTIRVKTCNRHTAELLETGRFKASTEVINMSDAGKCAVVPCGDAATAQGTIECYSAYEVSAAVPGD